MIWDEALTRRCQDAANTAGTYGMPVVFDGMIAIPEGPFTEAQRLRIQHEEREVNTPTMIGPEGDRVWFFLVPDDIPFEYLVLADEVASN